VTQPTDASGGSVFPPAQRAEVKALACELPAETGVPLSRWSSAELARAAVKRGIVATVAAITIWRWLREDAIRPWNYRSWIFPRDPQFAEKAGRILDLYEGRWEGQLLEPGEFVVCADEKPWECHKVCVRQERMEPHAFNTTEEDLISASLL
jgi:hypothetical protein